MRTSPGTREQVVQIAQSAARDVLKEFVKEAVREANEETTTRSSGRRTSGSLLMLGIGIAIGYAAAGKRLNLDEFLGDLDKTLAELERAFEGTEAEDLVNEAVGNIESGMGEEKTVDGGRKGPGLVVALLLTGIVGYLVTKKKGDTSIDEIIETEEVPVPGEDVDIGESGGEEDEAETEESGVEDEE